MKVTKNLPSNPSQRLPIELSLRVFEYLSWTDLLTCSAVSRRWYRLANDPVVWRTICDAHGWAWRRPTSMIREFERLRKPQLEDEVPSDDDEGMGSDQEAYESANEETHLAPQPSRLTQALPAYQIGYSHNSSSSLTLDNRKRQRHSAPSTFASPSPIPIPNYKLLHQTHVRLRGRVLRGSYELTVLQDRARRNELPRPTGPTGHTATIYCLQLHILPDGEQVLFTGSKDRTLREWDLTGRCVRRVFSGAHTSSILSLCAHGGYLASGDSDCAVALWDLATGHLMLRRKDHTNSVLSVRFDDERLVTCSKGNDYSPLLSFSHTHILWQIGQSERTACPG
jgi:hypothetical protein